MTTLVESFAPRLGDLDAAEALVLGTHDDNDNNSNNSKNSKNNDNNK